MLLLIGFCAFVTVALLAVGVLRLVMAPRARLHARLALVTDAGGVAAPPDRSMLRVQNYSDLPLLQRFLQGTARAERLADELDRAAISIRVGEFYALSVLAGVVSGVAVYLLTPSGSLGGVAALATMVAVGVLLPRRTVHWRLRRRIARFSAQLPDALDILARSLRAGNGLLVSIDALVEQMRGVVGDEFSRMRREIAAGVGVEDALRELDRRMGSRDLHIVVTAFLVQREVGGNLAEILDNVARTMRERVDLRGELVAITSQQRFATWVVSAVPPFILGMLFLINPALTQSMFSYTAGWIVLGIAITLEVCGILVLRMLLTTFEV